MSERFEFGQKRTVCACETCTNNCRHMPGFLIPSDLDRMVNQKMQVLAWAEIALRASPGALVMNSRTGEMFRIPTLVPRKKDGVCVYLLQGNCGIHSIAPFGCAFFDCSTPRSISDHLAREGMIAVQEAWLHDSLYQRIWHHLFNKGLTAEAPEVLRRRMASSFTENGQPTNSQEKG